ncbi:hypothetical protein BaRGS_00037094 [Batillaria attramentaria]|uniref:Uncharacterized protein n=1 Tax=Batillaria attramentaria TaxID=370345 RepID=A0ABD0J9Y1_9CAEN
MRCARPTDDARLPAAFTTERSRSSDHRECARHCTQLVYLFTDRIMSRRRPGLQCSAPLQSVLSWGRTQAGDVT